MYQSMTAVAERLRFLISVAHRRDRRSEDYLRGERDTWRQALQTVQDVFGAGAIIVRPPITGHLTEEITVTKRDDPVPGAPTRINVALSGRKGRMVDVGCRPVAIRVAGHSIGGHLPQEVPLREGILVVREFRPNGFVIDEPPGDTRTEIEVYCATGAES